MTNEPQTEPIVVEYPTHTITYPVPGTVHTRTGGVVYAIFEFDLP